MQPSRLGVARCRVLVCCNRIGFTIAARDFSRRRGASDAHIPKWICKERATKAARKRTAALRVALKLACGVVARRSQPHWRGMLPPRRLATGQFERNDCKANSVIAHWLSGLLKMLGALGAPPVPRSQRTGRSGGDGFLTD